MHRIDRGRASAPPCLAGYRAGRDRWEDLTKDHREQLREQLTQLDGARCAYCEGLLATWGQHIEHFRRRSRSPELTFEWGNLFWSCEQPDCCGKHKDESGETRSRPYDPADLLKPDVDDPDDFFLFQKDGTIQINRGLMDRERRRAQETLRVFNLDPQHGRLRKMRSLAASFYMDRNPGVLEMLESLSVEERADYAREEIRLMEREEFATTIKHFLRQVL